MPDHGTGATDRNLMFSPLPGFLPQKPFDEIMLTDAGYTDPHAKDIPVCKVFNTKGEASSVLNALSNVAKPCPNECGPCCCVKPNTKPPPPDHVCHFPRSDGGTGDCSLYTRPEGDPTSVNFALFE